MNYTIFYSPEALKDLEETKEYISEDLNNPSAAVHTIDVILEAVRRLQILFRDF